MLVSDKTTDLASPVNRSGKDPAFVDFNLSPTLDDEFEIFGGRMSVPGGSSPFIKDEDHEDWFNQPITSNRGINMHSNPGFGHMPHGSIDPSELSMGSHYSGFQHQGNPSHFQVGSAIADDELLDLDLNDRGHMQNNNQTQDYYSQGQPIPQHNQGIHNMFSTNTPTGDPIQSPFLHGGFNYGTHQQQSFASHISPRMRASNAQDFGFGSARARGSMPHPLERKPSDIRTPQTPNPPTLGGLNLGHTPDSGTLPQNIKGLSHRHQKSLSGQWDSTPGHSYVESPTASPGHHMNHAQISEVLKSGKSLPNKIETHSSMPAYQSAEAKRRRRRESHNMVERRRRDNINERIQELSHLVPQHRLEDEKVRKHLATNGAGPMSPSLIASGLSGQPSILAGGRRATAGSISMDIPMDDKDKGPNKGDILNGSVSWTRDLMWCLTNKLQQEAQLREIVANLGGTWPFQESEDEKRMYTELMEAMDKNDGETFAYSRADGTGLRVPKHTTLSGDRVGSSSGMPSDSSVSPGLQLNSATTQQPFWSTGNDNSRIFKEEDEYNMQL